MKQILIFILLLCSSLCILAQDVVIKRQKPQTINTKRSTTSSSQVNKQKNNVSEPTGYSNGHGYVDLGLPSGTLWATCNIGASSPDGYGYYYAWGEVSTKKTYHENNSKWHKKTLNDLKSIGVVDTSGYLTPQYDVGRQKWGMLWSMPNVDQIKELFMNTIKTWTKINGRSGYLLKSLVNDNSIFLPAAGNRYYGTLRDSGVLGEYWSSISSDGCGVKLHFNSVKHIPILCFPIIMDFRFDLSITIKDKNLI